MSLLTAEENLLKQKSRIQWLNLGDGNNSFFHNLVKVRNSSNLIKVLMDNEGNSITTKIEAICDQCLVAFQAP
jgi:hypothetical protein